MLLKPSIWQIVNPFFLQDWQDANPSAVSYPLNVADGVKGWSSAVDPLSLDIAGLPAGTLATTTELAINNGTVNEKTTLSDLATFLGGGGTPSDLAVNVATTAVLPWTPTYDNGTSGVGATLTRSSNGTTGAIDGVAAASLVAGDYILVKNQAAQLQNGVYEITQQGTASLPYILTRVTEADTSAELDDLVVTAALGTTNKGIPYGQQTNNPIIGTNNIVFTATGIYMRQQTSGTQAINQIPVYTATGLTQTKGTANFKYNPTNDLFTIRGIDYTFPANNGDASQVLTTDGSGNLSWTSAGGGTPAGSNTQIQYNNAGAFGASSDFTFDPATSTFTATANNNWEVFRTKITFASGGGTNDLTASDATAFTGTPPTIFYVIAFGNIQIVNYTNLVGGNFSQGDIITGSISGAQGTVAYDDGSGQLYVSITNSIQFATGDVIDNSNGVTADYDTSTTSDDIFFWFSSNGGTGGPTVITGSSQALNDGISITFGSTTGHGAVDSWYWSYKTLKNTVLSNRKIGSGFFGGAINGSYFKSGSGLSTIQAINGFFQNGDDDRIFPLSAYEDLTGNNADKERAYYGFNPFKNDPSEPLEYTVHMRKGIGPGRVSTNFTEFRISSLSGFRLETNKSILMKSPLFNVSDSTFTWIGGTNSTGITIDDVNEQITISNLPAYDDDAAAGTGGLTTGMVYMTTGSGSAPLNAAGILMIKQ